MAAGAAGYLPKTTPHSIITHALRLVAAGGRYIPPQVLGVHSARPDLSMPAQLTPRQLDVLGLVNQGLSNKQIGRRLGIAVETVKQHLQLAYGVLGASSRIQAVVAARRLGIDLERRGQKGSG